LADVPATVYTFVLYTMMTLMSGPLLLSIGFIWHNVCSKYYSSRFIFCGNNWW